MPAPALELTTLCRTVLPVPKTRIFQGPRDEGFDPEVMERLRGLGYVE